MEQQKRNYQNHSIKASKLVRDVRLGVMQDVFFAPHEKHNLVSSLTLDQVSHTKLPTNLQSQHFPIFS